MNMAALRRIRSLSLIAAGAAAAVLASAASAAAAPSASAPAAATRWHSTAAQGCDNAGLTQPFSPWGDANLYKLVTGGSFEPGDPSWMLTPGAGTAPGSESFGVTGTIGSSSLELPAGTSAQSPFTCVDITYPSFRLFARSLGGPSAVLVQVVYREVGLGTTVLPVGTLSASGDWSPSEQLASASTVPSLLAGGTTQVALRFTALTGDTQIDDVFIDPRMHH